MRMNGFNIYMAVYILDFMTNDTLPRRRETESQMHEIYSHMSETLQKKRIA